MATLTATAERLAELWSLELGQPFGPGATAWVAPARDPLGRELILKVGRRHPEAEHEADALRLWDGDGAVRCYESELDGDTSALLLERCVPGVSLREVLPEPEQDVVVAGLLRRLWAHTPAVVEPFRALQVMCDEWADSITEDTGLSRDAVALLRSLPRTASREVLLCTDLHAGNILSSTREPWLVIDPKPYVGDPAYDVVQHMLNCDERLATDPAAMCAGLADLLDLDRDRVRMWLYARCAQESARNPLLGAAARRLSP